MLDNKLLGQKLKSLREEFNYSQKEIAEKLMIPRPSVSQIEAGKRDVTASELAAYASIFKMSVDKLLQEEKSDSEELKSTNEKTIIFFRHGEAMDDLYDQYGGWADPELSAKGVNKAYTVAQKVKRSDLKADIIYSSPLKRAYSKAEILGCELDLEVKRLQYLKERNTYGLLCGVNKDIAKKHYPELVKSYKDGKYVLGSERYEDFVDRLKLLFEFINNQIDNELICVTHGKLLKAIMKEFLSMEPDNLEDGCMLMVGQDEKGLYYKKSEGITFTR